MVASDYPITTGYGWIKGYELNLDPVNHPGYGLHRGVDRGCPVGTPVVVNGVQIGLSGNTGSVFPVPTASHPNNGQHLHIGCFLSGNHDTNPGNGGFSFRVAVVSQTGYDAVNGNFVKLAADGAVWVYLHLSKITVSVGRVLTPPAPQPKGDDVAIIQNTDPWFFRFNRTMNQIRGRDASRAEMLPFVGQDFLHAVEAIEDNPEADQATTWQNLGKSAATQLATQQKNIDTLYAQVDELTKNNDALKSELATKVLQKETPAPVPQNTYEPAVVSPNWLTKLLAKFIK